MTERPPAGLLRGRATASRKRYVASALCKQSTGGAARRCQRMGGRSGGRSFWEG